MSVNILAELGYKAHNDGFPRDYENWAKPKDDSLHWNKSFEKEEEWLIGWDEAHEFELEKIVALSDINAMHRNCITMG